MKKKLIIGALAVTSILAFAQTKDEASTNSTDRRFWGSGDIEYIDGCAPTGEIQADGTPKCKCTAHYTYYVFWIGFEASEPYYTAC